MLIIKRYANRKLYDTQSKQYVTLEAIAVLVRAGVDVQVIDNETDEDLTALILSQIILEQEKQRKDFLPHSVLSALIQAGGSSLKNLRHKLERPLELINQVDELIEQRLNQLVEKGELAEEHARQLRLKLTNQKQDLPAGSQVPDEVLLRILEKQMLASQEEFQNLRVQFTALVEKLDELDL